MKSAVRDVLLLILIGDFFLVQNLFGDSDSFKTLKDNKEINRNCLRCHSMSTLGYQDPLNGIIKNLSVNPENFYNSNHKDLECIECHSADFKTFPHPSQLRNENLYCLNCHQDKPELFKYSFKVIEQDFKQSIHFQKFGNKFTCFNCHDPHSFKINARVNKEIKKTVLYDNHICLECHNNKTKIAVFTDEIIPDLNSSHQWLPHAELHWKSVRCIDCHTGKSSAGISHKILPKEKALRNCVECHSTNSILVQSLYKFQTKQERNKEGFINAVILNNSYVIGATRNYYLNLLSFIIFGLTITGISIHGILRWKFNRRGKDGE
jgi:Zn finger protein HypA/HybF involved in hydrogenase expression